jgi:hypothetical protein
MIMMMIMIMTDLCKVNVEGIEHNNTRKPLMIATLWSKQVVL